MSERGIIFGVVFRAEREDDTITPNMHILEVILKKGLGLFLGNW